ncbi:MAG: nucleotidyltransferase domain-containing protein [Anaerolineae bacterium]
MTGVEALREGLGDRLIAVILFGSRARGEADTDSDGDLLVIARYLPQKPFQRHLFLEAITPARVARAGGDSRPDSRRATARSCPTGGRKDPQKCC